MSPSDAARFETLLPRQLRRGPALRRAPHRRATAEEIAAETFAVAWRRLDGVPVHPPRLDADGKPHPDRSRGTFTVTVEALYHLPPTPENLAKLRR